jgi:hypothetical protein
VHRKIIAATEKIEQHFEPAKRESEEGRLEQQIGCVLGNCLHASIETSCEFPGSAPLEWGLKAPRIAKWSQTSEQFD